MANEANRGKKAEGLLDKEFKKLDLSLPNFTYERVYDARSSRGAISNPRSGDFVWYYKGFNILIELKEVKHDYRLPTANFELDQRARMRKRELAGSICVVIVYHSTTEKWRLLPLSWFGTLKSGSWNFLGMAQGDMQDIIKSLTDMETTLCHLSPPKN